MKKFFFLIFLLWSSAEALEIQCKFEEVYSDGSTQQGYLLIKNKKLRYEYDKRELFTIFRDSSDYFIVANYDKKNYRKIKEQNIVLSKIVQLIDEYPNLKNTYEEDSIKLLLEKSDISGFYKRISIQSSEVNLSIFFNDCNYLSISDEFLKYNPLVEYNYK